MEPLKVPPPLPEKHEVEMSSLSPKTGVKQKTSKITPAPPAQLETPKVTPITTTKSEHQELMQNLASDFIFGSDEDLVNIRQDMFPFWRCPFFSLLPLELSRLSVCFYQTPAPAALHNSQIPT